MSPSMRRPSTGQPEHWPFVTERDGERYATELVVRFEGGEGVIRNVSANGIYFVTDAALEKGQTLTFTLEYHNFPNGPIAVNCIALVVRVEEQGTQRGIAASISSFEFHRIPKPGESPDKESHET